MARSDEEQPSRGFKVDDRRRFAGDDSGVFLSHEVGRRTRRIQLEEHVRFAQGWPGLQALVGHCCYVESPVFEERSHLPKLVTKLNLHVAVCGFEAILEQDHSKALRATLMNHFIADYDQARGILDKIWPI